MYKRIVYSIVFVVIVIAGLLTRRVGWLPASAGDAMWAMMMFCIWRVVCPAMKLRWVATGSLVTCYAVEVSQLIRWPWLVTFRSTTIGHLILGQGFLWSDLIAYTVGVVAIAAVASVIEKRLS